MGLQKVGNQVQKGDCCGGYNQFNEDYVWAMFQRGYPKHKVVDVEPFTVTSDDDYNGIENGIQILFGHFKFRGDIANFTCSMIDIDGLPIVVMLNDDALQDDNYLSLCLIEQAGEVENAGWTFHGWLVNMLGEITGVGLALEFFEMIGSSYPVKTAMTAGKNLTPKEAVSSYDDNTIVLLPGKNEVSCVIDVQALLDDFADSVYETYTLVGLNSLIRGVNCDVVIIEQLANTITGVIRLLMVVNNIGANAEVTWATHVGVLAATDDDGNITSLVVYSSPDMLETSNVTGLPTGVNGSDQTFMNGLYAAKDSRKFVAIVDNDGAELLQVSSDIDGVIQNWGDLVDPGDDGQGRTENAVLIPFGVSRFVNPLVTVNLELTTEELFLFEFQQMVGASVPTMQDLGVGYQLGSSDPAAILVDTTRIYTDGADSWNFTLKLQRLTTGIPGVYQSYSLVQLSRLIRFNVPDDGFYGVIEAVDVANNVDGTCVVEFNISGVDGLQGNMIYWLDANAGASLSNFPGVFLSTGFCDALGNYISQIAGSPFTAPEQQYIKAMAFLTSLEIPVLRVKTVANNTSPVDPGVCVITFFTFGNMPPQALPALTNSTVTQVVTAEALGEVFEPFGGDFNIYVTTSLDV